MVMHLASLGAGKGASNSILVHDLFNSAANGTALSGETPAVGPTPANGNAQGELIINNGTATVPNASAGSDLYESLGQSDVSMSSFCTWSGACDLTWILRWVDASDYWTASYDPGSQTLYLIEITPSNNITRATSVASGHTSGSYSFKAQTSGTTISANLDTGAAVVSYTSSDYQSATSFGIAISWNFGSGGSSSDNFGPLTITHP